MRIRNKAGNMTSEELTNVAALAQKYGSGQVHVTVRQGIEIPGVKEELFEEAYQAILDAGLLPAVCGLRVRPVVSCPGNTTCPYGIVNSPALAAKLDDEFVGRDLPAKTKFAVSGCANACTKPQAHDIGFQGAVRPTLQAEKCTGCGACTKRCPAKAITKAGEKITIDYKACLSCGACVRICPKQALAAENTGFHIYAGGKGGRYSFAGQRLLTFVPETEVLPHLEAILAVYQETGEKGERIQALLARVGFAEFQAKLQEKLKA
jgi:dissimilatory sulfite reductase (desulfoviridin) alpha/beta subunit